MNKKIVLIGILILVSMTLSGCVWYEGYGYGYGYGYHGYPHSYRHHDYGYHHRDRDGGHYGPRHGSHHW